MGGRNEAYRCLLPAFKYKAKASYPILEHCREAPWPYQAATTQCYAHLADEPLRQAAEVFGSKIESLVSRKI
jgi:hypothetical protein